MTAYQTYRHFISQLTSIYNAGEAAAITSMVFFECLGKNKSDLLKNQEELLDDNDALLLQEKLARLLQHEPVQYVLEKAMFAGYSFQVNNKVLIPRPETEELVEKVNAHIATFGCNEVLDIGTGSGCIPVAVKLKNPHVRVSGIDVSDDAIEVAKTNASAHGAEVLFYCVDFLDVTQYDTLGQYDIIISNPPYIPASDLSSMDDNVKRHEPHLALFVSDEDPLVFYRQIANFAQQHLTTGGSVFMETHKDLASDVLQLFRENNFEGKVWQDMFGNNRMVIVNRYP